MRQPSRRMKDVLDPVNDHGPAGALGNVHDALEPQKTGTAMLGQYFQEKRQCHGVDRRIAHDGIGLELSAVPRMHSPVGAASLRGPAAERDCS